MKSFRKFNKKGNNRNEIKLRDKELFGHPKIVP